MNAKTIQTDSGFKVTISKTFTLEEEAEAYTRHCCSFHAMPRVTSLEQVVDEYLQGVEHVKAITIESYGNLLRPIVDVLGPDHSPHLTQKDINKYVEKRRGNGAGRVIAKELSRLRSALTFQGLDCSWTIPRSLSSIPKKEKYVPSSEEVWNILKQSSHETGLAISLCALAGFRPGEINNLWDYRPESKEITIHDRKSGQKNCIPVCKKVEAELINNVFDDSVIAVHSEIKADLRRLSNGKIRGLQAFRRWFVTTAEDKGWSFDQIALVTGHSRKSMTSRYSDSKPDAHMDLKRKIIESVEEELK